MNFIYTENPLEIIVELSDIEKQLLHANMLADELQSIIVEMGFYIEEKRYEHVKEAYDAYMGELFSKHMKDRYEELIIELKSNHVGDCICFPSPCSKCMAENLLGIDTTKGMNKHMGFYISEAFKKTNKCIEAVAIMKKNIPEEKPENYIKAIEWLENYQNKYLN